MKDPYLQEVTASEPLSLTEEYEMQAQWRYDPFKCTFLIKQNGDSWEIEHGIEAPPKGLIGDVNMFMHDAEDRSNAEIELMVALPQYRRHGVGRRAVSMMMRYGVEALGIKRFFAKISDTNIASIRLFEK